MSMVHLGTFPNPNGRPLEMLDIVLARGRCIVIRVYEIKHMERRACRVIVRQSSLVVVYCSERSSAVVSTFCRDGNRMLLLVLQLLAVSDLSTEVAVAAGK